MKMKPFFFFFFFNKLVIFQWQFVSGQGLSRIERHSCQTDGSCEGKCGEFPALCPLPFPVKSLRPRHGEFCTFFTQVVPLVPSSTLTSKHRPLCEKHLGSRPLLYWGHPYTVDASVVMPQARGARSPRETRRKSHCPAFSSFFDT